MMQSVVTGIVFEDVTDKDSASLIWRQIDACLVLVKCLVDDVPQEFEFLISETIIIDGAVSDKVLREYFLAGVRENIEQLERSIKCN